MIVLRVFFGGICDGFSMCVGINGMRRIPLRLNGKDVSESEMKTAIVTMICARYG